MSTSRRGQAPSPTGYRSRQSKKDNAIRRKIETELSKKRSLGFRVTRKGRGLPGTVLSLKPSEPIICKRTATVHEAAQLMSARRENCVLVVSDDDDLIGILTAKDLAFRIVGSDLSSTFVTIEQIMTPSPLCARSNSPASEALTLMVEKGFRHLPILDESNSIVGVLDITRSYAQQMEKLERFDASAKKLHEALDSVHLEIGISDQPQHVLEYFATLKSKMDGPTLQSVLNHRTNPVYANLKTTVYEATLLMKEYRTTAVLVKDSSEAVTGIFTSKDVVLRVIAAGLDPKNCSLVRVMTPQPDVAKYSTSIQTALRQMFDGHFLNLPVVDDENEIIGIVDVLKLTHATLNQIKRIEMSNDNKAIDEGPAWTKFWTSLDNTDSESLHTNSPARTPDTTSSDLHQLNLDINPSDSISAADENSITKYQSMSDDSPFIFKFRSPAVKKRVHRVLFKSSDSLEDLRRVIDEKLQVKDIEALNICNEELFAISYLDDEGDVVCITSDADLQDCIRVHREMKHNKADLFLHNPHEEAAIEMSRLLRNRFQANINDTTMGIPNSIILSGAIGATSIVAALAIFYNRK